MPNIAALFQSQFRSSLEMLHQAVEKCPPELWNRPADQNPAWQVGYHAAFYVHFYGSSSQSAFTFWSKHRGQGHDLKKQPAPPQDPSANLEPYTQAEIIEYIDFIKNQILPTFSDLDLDGPSGFYWLPFNKLETLVYALRHLQHHTGELYERLGQVKIELPWIV